ncbi:MAG: YitT family protein [Bacilli bacterium]|nr:YitT family protein [Bacilli bacterium]
MALIESEIIAIIKKKKLISRYVMLVITLLISAFLFNFLIVPTKIVTGGVNGVALLMNHLYDFDNSVVILGVSIILLIFSLLFLGLERTSGSIVATILYPLLVKVTSLLTENIHIDTSDMVLIAIFIGVIGGLANGLMYKTGFSNGGLPIISQILYEKFKIPISKSSFVINGTIVFVGGMFFGWTMVMYAMIILFINSFVLDRVMLGVSNNKAFYIITSQSEEVKTYIIKHLKHSVTVFDVKGGFMERKRMVLLTVIPSREYFRVTQGIKEIDSDVFFLTCDAYQVEGGR